MLYGCDAQWWRLKSPEFKGLRVSGEAFKGCFHAEMRNVERLILDGTGIGAGGNSAFQALNLAILWGSRRVILTGVDLNGDHWHGKHSEGLRNPAEAAFKRWHRAFSVAAKQCRDIGVTVINANPASHLEAFPKMTVHEALNA